MSMAPKLRVKELIIGIQQDCGRYADLLRDSFPSPATERAP